MFAGLAYSEITVNYSEINMFFFFFGYYNKFLFVNFLYSKNIFNAINNEIVILVV